MGGNSITHKQKEDILKGIALLLDGMEEKTENNIFDRCRMLTIRECAQLAEGLSEHTIRLLVKRGELPAMRTGIGRNGKILISEKALKKYIDGVSH